MSTKYSGAYFYVCVSGECASPCNMFSTVDLPMVCDCCRQTMTRDSPPTTKRLDEWTLQVANTVIELKLARERMQMVEAAEAMLRDA